MRNILFVEKVFKEENLLLKAGSTVIRLIRIQVLVFMLVTVMHS